MSRLTPMDIDDGVAIEMDTLMCAGRSGANALPTVLSAQLTLARRRRTAARSAHALRAAGLSALLAALPACTPAPDATASSSPLQPAAGAPSNGPASAQPLSASDLQQRLVAYAASLREPSDASEEQFSRAMKITLTPFEQGRAGGEAKDQPMADGYAFYASYGSPTRGMKAPYHGVSIYRPGRKALTEDPQAPCFWAASAAREALAAIGYERGGERAYQRGRLQQYRRASSVGSTVFYADLLTYPTGGPVPEVCVYEVRFSGDVP